MANDATIKVLGQLSQKAAASDPEHLVNKNELDKALTEHAASVSAELAKLKEEAGGNFDESMLESLATKDAAFFDVTITKTGTTFAVTMDDLSEPYPLLVTLRGIVDGNYAAGDTLTINGAAVQVFSPAMEALPANAWKAGAAIDLLWETSTSRAFFKAGGGKTGGGGGSGIDEWDENTDYTLPMAVFGSDNDLYKALKPSGPSTEAGPVDPTTEPRPDPTPTPGGGSDMVTELVDIPEDFANLSWTASAFGLQGTTPTFVAVAAGGRTALHSTDGTTWSNTVGIGTKDWSAVTAGAGIFVKVATNIDGKFEYLPGTSFTWNETNYVLAGTYPSIIRNLDNFVTVGTDLNMGTSELRYSASGNSWTKLDITSAAGGSVIIGYGNNLHLMLSPGRGWIKHSTDYKSSSSWVLSTTPFEAVWSSVAYGNATFVAVASGTSKCVYSADGVIWTAAELPFSADWSSITYGLGRFVALASGRNQGAYSLDGVTWTAFELGATAEWSTISYGLNKFVAFARNFNKVASITVDDTVGTRAAVPATPRADTGLEWQSSLLSSSISNWAAISYGSGKFVALNGGRTVVYSSDGISWSESSTASFGNWQGVIYGKDKFVAVANASSTMNYSADGVSWTASALPDASKWRSVAYGNGMYVAVAYDTNVSAYSTDGVNWVGSRMPVSTYWESVTYGNGKFVAVPAGRTSVAYSVDGISWSSSTLPTTAPSGRFVTYGDGKFVLVSSSSKSSAYSTDGINWIATTMPVSTWNRVAYGDGKFLAVSGPSSLASYSTNGVDWVSSTMPTSSNWTDVAYGSGRFAALASNANSAAYAIVSEPPYENYWKYIG